MEHANGSISQIFDKEKEQQRIQQAQLVGEMVSQATDIVRSEMAIHATEAAKAKLATASKDDLDKARQDILDKNPKANPDAEAIASQAYQNYYDAEVKASGFGVGGKYSRVMDTAGAVIKGLAGSDLGAALAGGAAPWIAEYIGHGNLHLSDEEKIAAHAVVNAALAAAQGQNAAAGAAGAVTGELTGMIAEEMYGKKAGLLTESEKETVSALATLASGLAGGLVGDSTQSAVYAAQAGKTTVENNLMRGTEFGQEEFIRQHGIDMASCTDAPGSASCQKAKNERDAVGLALATGSVAFLPGSAQVMWGLGATANAGIGYMADGTIDPANAAIAGWVNVFSMGNGLVGTVGWNAAGGALGNWLDDKDPLSGAISNGTGAAFGYGLGKGVSWATNAGANWWKGGWDPKYNPVLRAYTEVKGDFGISKEMTPSNIPGFFGDVGGSVFSETTGKGAEAVVNKVKEKNEKK